MGCTIGVLVRRVLASGAGIFLLAAAMQGFAVESRRVVILNATDPYLPAFLALDGAMREAIRAGRGEPTELYAETLDMTRFPRGVVEEDVLGLLRKKYRALDVDVVVAVETLALDFAQRHRDEIWPGATIVFHSVSTGSLSALKLGPRVIGLPTRLEFGQTLELALKLRPEAKRIVVVAGGAELDRRFLSRARPAIERYAGVLETRYLEGLPLDELIEVVRAVPPDSVVLYLSVFRDGAGTPQVPRNVLTRISEASRVPVFGVFETYLGHGIVAGSIASYEAQGRGAGELVVRVLKGEDPFAIGVQEPVSSGCIADWRQLRRLGIAEGLLPRECEVRYREVTLWNRYRVQILAVLLVIVAQAAMIVALLLQRSWRRRAESELRESESRFRSTADSAPVMIWMSGPNKRREYCNKGWLDFTGRGMDQERGEGWKDAVHPDDRQRYVDTYDAAFDARQPFEVEFRLRRHDGEYCWMLSRGVPRYASNGGFLGYTGSSLDITDRKRVEETNQHLAHVSRLAVVGELTAAIAHEINQPLGAIRSNADAAEMLLETGADRLPEVRQILDDIRRDDARASEVVRRIREMLQKHEPEVKPYDLNEVVRDCVRTVGGEAVRRGVTIETGAADLPIIYGDRIQTQQALLNLMLNGMDALSSMPRGMSRLSVSTSRGSKGMARVTVADTGPGIPPEQISRIFESFYTSKKDGMGLGLSIARFMVEAQGGRIWVESRETEGAVFHVEFPMGRQERRS